MSQDNANNSIFVESETEDEEHKEDDEQDWGGSLENEVILPDRQLLNAIFGILPVGLLPPPPIQSYPINSESIQLPPTQLVIRPRRENSSAPPPKKLFRTESGSRIVKKFTDYNYIRLKSGVEYTFTEEDGKKLLLTDVLEPNRLIRNIISRIPINIKDRLEYLGEFKYEEDDSDEDEDEEAEAEGQRETNQKEEGELTRRYYGKLEDRVFEAYIREWRLKHIFRKLLVVWRIYKMNKDCQKELDPITLSEPEKEVYVYDWTVRRKFIFDARSLATLIETQLLYQEHGFALPIYPRNPKNNVSFTYKQMIAIHNQLQAHGELRWGMTTLRQHNFDKNRWHLYHKSALTVNSIKVSISLLDTFEAKELLSDFIFAKMDDLGFKYNNYTFNTYQVAMTYAPKHWYLEKLKRLAIVHYEAEHFGHNKTRFINAACTRIFRKQQVFIKDLQNKKII